jgi:hypothetical protein
MNKKIVPIYPTGAGHYALCAPDGVELRAGLPIKIFLAGQQLPGQIQWSPNGDYIRFDDETLCGLHPAMCVVAPPARDLKARRRRGHYRPRTPWTIDRQQHLSERYLQLVLDDPQRSLHSIGCQIAEETGGDRVLVCAKLYQLRASLTGELRRRQQLRDQQRIIRQRWQLIDQSPIRLLPGGTLWIVRQPTETTTWLLDYPHGACPVVPGQLCLYDRAIYRAGLVGSSHFSIIPVLPSIQSVQGFQIQEGADNAI